MNKGGRRSHPVRDLWLYLYAQEAHARPRPKPHKRFKRFPWSESWKEARDKCGVELELDGVRAACDRTKGLLRQGKIVEVIEKCIAKYIERYSPDRRLRGQRGPDRGPRVFDAVYRYEIYDCVELARAQGQSWRRAYALARKEVADTYGKNLSLGAIRGTYEKMKRLRPSHL